MKIQNRFKSPVLWTSILAAIALLLKGFGVYEIDDATLNTVTSILLSILTMFGIVNSPSSKNTLQLQFKRDAFSASLFLAFFMASIWIKAVIRFHSIMPIKVDYCLVIVQPACCELMIFFSTQLLKQWYYLLDLVMTRSANIYGYVVLAKESTGEDMMSCHHSFLFALWANRSLAHINHRLIVKFRR